MGAKCCKEGGAATRGYDGPTNLAQIKAAMAEDQGAQEAEDPHAPPEPQYPMYVMSVKDVLQLDKLQDHQELLKAGKLVPFEDSMEVIFVSHQWLGFKHPDAGFRQFGILQQALKNLIGGMDMQLWGTTSFSLGYYQPLTTPEDCRGLKDAYIWYDFFGVPQVTSRSATQEVGKDLQAAVDSIPAYVQLCKHFFILAPDSTHADTGKGCNGRSYYTRGWCRVELAARAFSLRPHCPMAFVFQPTYVIESHPFAWVEAQPRFGDFTVEADRPKVAQVMAGVMDRRMSYDRAQGRTFEFRFLKAMSAHVAEGRQAAAVVDLAAWLKGYDFPPEDPLAASGANIPAYGWAPIHFAALEANDGILRELLRLGEKVDRTTTHVHIGFSAQAGLTPLMIVAKLVADVAAGVRVSTVLLEHKADIKAMSEMDHAGHGGGSALHYAAGGAAKGPELMKFLLDAGAGLEDLTVGGFTPLIAASYYWYTSFPKTEKAEHLVRQGADPMYEANVMGIGFTPLKLTAGGGSDDDIRLLMKHGGKVQPAASARKVSKESTCSSQDTASTEAPPSEPQEEDGGGGGIPGLDPKSNAAWFLTSMPEASAMHWAAAQGNAAVVELLLKEGVDPRVLNKRGVTPQTLAREAGAMELAEVLQKAEAAADAAHRG